MASTNSKTIVLTRDSAGNADWGPRLEQLGFKVYSLPTIETSPLELDVEQKGITRHLSDYDWLVFTSAKCVQYFIGVLFQLEIKWPSDKPKVAAIGARTAQLIEGRDIRVNFIPTKSNSKTLGDELTQAKGARILLPHTDIASNNLATQLTGRGGKVTSLPIYTTQTIAKPDEAFSHRLVEETKDILVFASPSAVHGFSLRITGPTLLQEAKSLPAIAIGSSTASALDDAGYTNIYTSRTPTFEGIVEVLKRLVSH